MVKDGTQEDKEETQDDAPESSIKKSKITKKDLERVEQQLKKDLDLRKKSEYRTKHEDQWKEVDRQISMSPMARALRNPDDPETDWRAALELGLLSKASEDLSADVRRIIFTDIHPWFDPHSKIDWPLDPNTGEQNADPSMQETVDERLRAMMMQQQEDFGLKDRVDLSIKEALHHGSFVAEIDWEEQQMVFEGSKVQTFGSPVWKPHSMWNCWPDPSPSIIGTNLFYSGSMFVRSYLPRYKCEQLALSGEGGWFPSQWKKVRKDEHKVGEDQSVKDVEIVTFWGDLIIEKSKEENLYFPNHKAMMFNGTLIYMAPNKTPYIPIIYRGYERMDVRDPYYTSPIIKQSPMGKYASVMCNRSVDAIALAVEPPITYDGNDPDFVVNGGPVVAPGSKTSSKSNTPFQQVKIGDAKPAIEAMTLAINHIKEMVGAPMPMGDRATAAEVNKKDADSEVSVIDFIDNVEIALRSYLYMHHQMNLVKLDEYPYYNPEMGDSDFLIGRGKELPEAVHFEVVGGRAVLGEAQRNDKTTMVLAFAAKIPQMSGIMDWEESALSMLEDAGNKNPERFLIPREKRNQVPPQVQQKMEQMQQALQKLAGMYKDEKSKNQVHLTKIQTDHQDKQQKMQLDHQVKQEKLKAEYEEKMQRLELEKNALLVQHKEHLDNLGLKTHEQFHEVTKHLSERAERASERASDNPVQQ